MKFVYLFVFILFSGSFENIHRGVSIIVRNDSKENFKKLILFLDGKNYQFTDLKSGSKIKACKVEKAYRYCQARAMTEKDTLCFIPIDYLGEKLYTKGRLIMRLDIKVQDGMRYLDFKQ